MRSDVARRPVMPHKFTPGQEVTLAPSRYGAARLLRFRILRLLPTENGVNQYRLKAVVDGHERVAMESELT
jgi:hypothetical protein